jgi:hypothetical protein
VARKINALHAIVKDWECLVVHLESISERKGEEGNTAKGLLKKIKDFKSVIAIHFLYYYLTVFKRLSLVFQRQDLILSQITVHAKKAINSMEQLKDTKGSMEEKSVSATTLSGVFSGIQLSGVSDKNFTSDKENLLTSGITFLEDRFLTNEDIQSAIGVFDTYSWPSGKLLENYGHSEIKVLATHFSKHLEIEEDNIDDVLSEYSAKVFH